MDVVVVLKGMTTSLSSFRAELLSRAASRSPARAKASGGEGRGARPRAADEQLVGGGQGVCALRRVERGGVYIMGDEVRAGRRERGYTRRHSDGMRGARLKAWGTRARAERTPNILLMSVTLEVSKLSGWLKADAPCRVEGRAHAMRGGEDKRHARGKGPTQGLGAKDTRGAHLEHPAHGRDAGGVEAQRLVEGERALPSRREGMRCGEGEVRGGRRVGLWCGGGTTSGMHGEKARLKAWGPRARAESAQRTWSASS
jgi:hypothetical protein